MTGVGGLGEGSAGRVGRRLNELLSEADLPHLDSALANKFEAYLALILHWNSRMNLTSIRDEEGILSRHFVESIGCAHAVPGGVKTMLDFGSGGGFPGIPIALCRPEIAVTLAESQGKKAAFLREAVRTLGLGARVYAGRAEALGRTFECVTLRAVERMELAVAAAADLVEAGGYLVVMTTEGELGGMQSVAGGQFSWDAVRFSRVGWRVVDVGRKNLV